MEIYGMPYSKQRQSFLLPDGQLVNRDSVFSCQTVR